MAKGSIRFNNDINVEVDVDPAADEGARLTSAKNLVDGQELGIGGSDLPEVTAADAGKVLAVNASGEWAAETPNTICIKGIATSMIEEPPTLYVKMEGEESSGARYDEIVRLRNNGVLIVFGIAVYIKDGQIDPTGTGTLMSMNFYYPYGTVAGNWRTLAEDSELQGSSVLWSIGEVSN